MKYLKGIVIFIRLIRESLLFAYSSIIANKLRTFLSLLGVTIGIFAIISMFTVIDSLENNIASRLSAIGNDIIYVDRFPWDNDSDYKWWKYIQRPRNTYEECQYLQQNCSTIEAAAIIAGFSRQVKYKSKTADSYILGTTHDWEKISPPKITEGRYFSIMESQNGTSVAILGAVAAETLFTDESPIGKYIKIGGRTALVIGVLEKEGDNMLSINNFDNGIMVPYNLAKTIINMRYSSPQLAVKAKAGVSIEAMGADVRLQLRAIRRLKPMQEDNFALNELSILKNITDKIFGVINLVGWVIGGFSILVGGFGIANIMFVSVKERTPIIGVQKALGAKNYFILIQFLAEAAFLALMGGAIGLLLIFGASALVSSMSDGFTLTLTISNISLGLTISAIVGILSGLIPAFMASRLNPVVAINSK